MWEEAKGEGRTGRFGLRTESNECMRETVSDIGEAALVGPPLDLPWRRIVIEVAIVNGEEGGIVQT